ncbi:MAG TPA: TIGR03619 family F420-dependent LLM class oxidoreductase [Candidatus Limnocylindrales bacterium]|jgi:probable F420-dependent oxidoreductase|nr:TIGR03619 family F420-dependent LLM class oxidoreductase [Candidatus Limnocylindrales bacterium]
MVELYVRLPHSWCGASRAAVVEVAAAAEELGFAGVSVQDHVLASRAVAPCGSHHEGDDRMVMESLATLAFVAGRTRRVKLLTGVLVLPFRHVVWTAKMGATVDLLSDGRLVLGVGVGARRDRRTDGIQHLGPHADVASREQALFDLPAPRGALMDELLAALDVLWREDPASYAGRYIRFEGVDLLPRPVQRPRPPIWIGGRADAAIRRAATLGDAWFPSQASVGFVGGRREQLQSIARAAGRPEPAIGVNLFAAIDDDAERARSVVRDGLGHRFTSERALFEATIAGDPDDVLDRLRAYVAVGVTAFDLKLLPHRLADVIGHLELLARTVLPALAESSPG